MPYYLVVEEFDAVLHEWHDGEYHLAAKSEGGVLRLQRPFPVVLALGG
ncbi:hypothetical protein [Amycolatopsis albispora]|nr:hypothetical protein [Amycolatopsis albispora]